MAVFLNLLIFALVFLGATQLEANGARIIGVLSTGSKSRYANMRNLAEELSLRNHEVLLVVPSAVPFAPSKLIKHSIYKVPVDEDYLENEMVPIAFNRTYSNTVNITQTWVKYFVETCACLITHVKNTLNHWREFNLILAEEPPVCGAIISDLLQLPRIDIAPAYVLRLYRGGIGPLSYIPHMYSSSNSKMNFIQRVQNTLTGLLMKFVLVRTYPAFDELKKRFNILPERSFKESMEMSELVIIMGHFALEYAQPVLPNYKFVGPLTIKPPMKLPPDLENFVRGAGDKGVVIFSLGTLGDVLLRQHHIGILASAFGRLKQRVVWRLTKHVPQHLPSNVKVVNWIPQNDLLADSSTKVFISHTGHNSLYESAFYGVPLVCIPLFEDQFSNCIQAQSVGIAVGIDIRSMSEDEVYQKIQLVLSTPSFHRNATRISALMQDSSRTPVQQAADWIEYVHWHKGARHLRAQVYDLYWYQEYLLDVGAFVLLVTVAILFMTKTMLKCLCKIIYKTRGKRAESLKKD